MDKHEYKMCADEIKSLIRRKKYKEAMDLADTVDWNRVKNVNMLCTVSDLYKMGKRYEESRDIMLMAYERHPGDRMVVYSLCELSIKLDDVVQAVEYYKEFAQSSPNDNRRFILQYRLYEAQEVTLEERIDVLKNFKSRERREKWVYELAYLYHRVGLESECIEECDELFLWFGKGKYVRKAMELKMLHTTLTPQQQAFYDGVKPSKNTESFDTDDLEPSFKEYETDTRDNIKIEDQGLEDSDDDIMVAPVNVGKYATINLQRELAEQIQEVMSSDEDDAEDTGYINGDYQGDDGVYDEVHNDHYPEKPRRKKLREELFPEENTEDPYYGENPEDRYYQEPSGEARTKKRKRKRKQDYYGDENGYVVEYDQQYDREYDQEYDREYDREYDHKNKYGSEIRTTDRSFAEPDAAFKNKDHPYKKDKDLSNTDRIRNFESELGNTTEFKKLEAYNNSGIIPPIPQSQLTEGPVRLSSKRKAGVNNTYPQDMWEMDEFYDIDGEASIENAPGKSLGIAPGKAGKIGQTTGNIIDKMMDEGRIDDDRADDNGADDSRIDDNRVDDGRADSKDMGINIPTSSIREITLSDEPQEQPEPKVVQMSTGKIPKIVDSEGSSINLASIASAAVEVPPAYNEDSYQVEPAPVSKKQQDNIPTAESMAREGDEKYDKFLSQESDGQISLAMEKAPEREKQITGQISLTDTFLEWEEKKKRRRELQEAEFQNRIKRQTGDMFQEFDKNTKEDLLNELGSLADSAIRGELKNKKKAPIDVAAMTQRGVPTDTSVLVSRAREVMEGRAPMENAAVSKVIAPRKDENYDPAMEAAQMDAAVNAVVRAAEAANARNIDKSHHRRRKVDDEVPIYEDGPDNNAVENGYDEDGQIHEGNYGDVDSYGNEQVKRERRTLTHDEKRLFGQFIQTKGTLNQILDALDNVSMASYTGNIILTGEPDMGTIKLAKALIKDIQNLDGNFSGKLAKISGDALNRKDIARTFEQLTGSALIVEGAGAMDSDTVNEMLDVLETEEQEIIVILEDNKINMNKLLNNNEALYDPFNLRIDLEAMDNDSLVNFAKRYAQDREYSIDEMGILELYTRISDLQTSEHTVTTRDVKQIVDDAIEKADKRNITQLLDIVMGKRYDDEDMVILRAKDFT